MRAAHGRTGSGPRGLGVVLLVAAPWSWFLVRDAHPLLEWVAILLPLLGVTGVLGLAALGAATGRPALLGVAASGAALTLLATLLPWTPRSTPAPEAGVRLLTANVLGNNPSPEAVALDLLGSRADVVVVNEITPLLREVSAQLGREYPYSVRFDGQDDVGVWSRYPLTEGGGPGADLPEAARGGRVVVAAPDGPFALHALHLYRPSRDAFRNEVTVQEQRRLLAEVDRVVRDDPLPAVLAGDLNVTDRATGYRRLLRGRVDAARAAWTGPTSRKLRNRPLLLRIDHLLLPQGWCSAKPTRTVLTGSDHLAVSATVGRCPTG